MNKNFIGKCLDGIAPFFITYFFASLCAIFFGVLSSGGFGGCKTQNRLTQIFPAFWVGCWLMEEVEE